MKKYIVLTFAFLFSLNMNTYAQRLFDDEGEDAQEFTLSFMFKYKDLDPVTISIRDLYGSAHDNQNTYGAELRFIGTGCDYENRWNIPIASRYSYDQLRQYLVDIDIRTFQPQSNGHDASSDLQIRVTFMSSGSTRTSNVFNWNYNSDNIGDETQILTYLFEVLNDNVSISCAEDAVELLETYIEE